MASTGKEAVRSFSRPGLRRDAGLGDQVMELVAARYAQLGVGAVQVGGDGGPFLPRAAGNPGRGRPRGPRRPHEPVQRGPAGPDDRRSMTMPMIDVYATAGTFADTHQLATDL